MTDRSHTIENTFTDLTDWGTMRDLVAAAVLLEGFSDPNNVILSEFTPDHAIYPDLLADLIFKATNCHPEVYAVLKSQNSVKDLMLAANRMRDLTNGTGNFSSASGWTAQAGWTISGGVASANIADGVFNNVTFDATVNPSKRYLFEFDITAYTSGGVNPRIRGFENIDGPRFTSAGHHRAVVPAHSNSNVTVGLGVVSAGGFVGTVDNLVIRELD